MDDIVTVAGANRAQRLRIRPGRFRFTRFQLSDGSFARLVETLVVENPVVETPAAGR